MDTYMEVNSATAGQHMLRFPNSETLFCEQYVSKVGVKFHVGPCRLLSEVGGTLGKRVLAAWLSGLSKALNSLQVSSQQNNVVPSVNLAAVLHGKFS
uniref:Uncharacterized protein n=1 Tax=Vespula pensylvanica TaxID=30213 RepID=A0A834P143_VESPE|nr:hypothetical protein H0235_009056 [Vespula pensylvanica]